MPGLLRGVARTAVIAGTATGVSNRVSRRQGRRWAAKEQQQYGPEPEPQYAPAPPPPPQYAPAPVAPAPAAPGFSESSIHQLQQLGELKAQGVLTEAEFTAAKAKILGS